MTTKTPGIYKITNEQTNRVYYGSTKDFEHRVKAHISTLKHDKHCNPGIQSDYKQGHTFRFELIAVIEERTERLKRERELIKASDNIYNLVSAQGISRYNRCGKRGDHCKGRPRRPETTAKIVAANTGKKRSAESRARISAAAKARPAVECPHCGKIGKGPFMHLNHFDRCKLAPSIT